MDKQVELRKYWNETEFSALGALNLVQPLKGDNTEQQQQILGSRWIAPKFACECVKGLKLEKCKKSYTEQNKTVGGKKREIEKQMCWDQRNCVC